MDKQIVDMDGRKVVRVNDVRLAVLSTGTFVVAVNVGIKLSKAYSKLSTMHVSSFFK